MSGVGRGEGLGVPPEDQWHPSQLPSRSDPARRGADRAHPANAAEVPIKVVAEPPSVAVPTEDDTPPEHRWRPPGPRLVRDAGLWVWIWVIGAVLLVVLLIVALASLPSKKGAGPRSHAVYEVVQTVTPPNSTVSWAVVQDGTLSETPGRGVSGGSQDA